MLLSVKKKITENYEVFKTSLLKLDNYDLSLKLTVLFILLHFSKQASNELFVIIFLISGLGILFDRFRQSKLFWGFQLTFYSIFCYIYWYSIDNHIYLWAYWLVAILISISTNKKEFLEISGKYLIAFCMFYAVLQKSLSYNYLNGDFFYFTLLTDMRFGFIGKFIQYDLSFLVSENLRTLDMMKSNTENYFLKAGPYILKPISYALTWYTFCIELIISILLTMVS